jgi:hypothetical protein
MPAIDISSPNQQAKKEGFGTGIPTPLLLIAVGGGIGLIVFLTKRTGAGGEEEDGTLLPNTAIMLGSLQQGVLELMGKVTTGDADLSNQMSGMGENLGLMIDTQSGQIQGGFADLNTYLNGAFGTIQGDQDALASAIATLGTQNVGLAQSLTTVLGHLLGIGQGIQNVQGQVSGIQSGVNNILNGQSQITSGIGALGNQISQIPLKQAGNTFAFDWGMLEGKKIFSIPDQGWYTVQSGKVIGVSFWDTVPNAPFSDAVSQINVNTSLKGYSTGTYVRPNA